MSIFEQYKLNPKHSTEDYTRMLERLLPDGIIWKLRKYFVSRFTQDVVSGLQWQDVYDSPEDIQDSIESGGVSGDVLLRFLSCFASELERFEQDAYFVFNQSDPGVAHPDYGLPDWERVLKLPEICWKDEDLTLLERQTIAHLKKYRTGETFTKQYITDYADSIGFTVTVEEIPEDTSPRIFGVATFGVEQFGGQSGYSILKITVTDGTPDIRLLICAINLIKPAHIIVRFEDDRS